jgi:DNA-directed RNA polymerase I and III subunit RPAC1
LKSFKRGFSITVRSLSDERVEFRVTGIDPAIANAFRRILIAEVPTIAIGECTIYQNTGQIHDENLAHRLGLVPIVLDPELLNFRQADEEFDEHNCIHFSLNVACPQGGVDGQGRYSTVYSRDLKWVPIGDQAQQFKGKEPRPVADDIIVAKLSPGQEIELLCKCEKGYGKAHTKWSPVCTAAYRLVPVIELTKPVVGDDARRLKEACPKGVIRLVDGPRGQKQAEVADPCCFNVHRERLDPFAELGVKVYSSADDFLFSVESVGTLPAPVLFEKAVGKLREKCESTSDIVKKIRGPRP